MADTTEYRLKLYVTGGTSACERATAAFRTLCRTIAGQVHSEIIDILLHPEFVLDMSIEPIPVLVREQPGPVRIIKGEMSEPEWLARVLTEEQ
jgi:circadian clock protein KaiB